MTSPPAGWTAHLVLRTGRPELAEWIRRALGPEAAREVPRARAELDPPQAGTVGLQIRARDAGAMRAALNTYLGWWDLSIAAVRSADGAPAAGSGGSS